MSGGAFDYQENVLLDLVESLDEELANKEFLRYTEENEESIIEAFKAFQECKAALVKANIFLHRIDYLVSGDDSVETFLNRLEEDLLEKEGWFYEH